MELELGTIYHRKVQKALLGGVQIVVRFANGYGASIINHSASYGVELAVILFGDNGMDDFALVYDTPVAVDVLGWLEPEELTKTLVDISKLPLRNGY